MTFDTNTKKIEINRGDRMTITLNNKLGNFKIGDKLKFSVVEKNHYENVVFQKYFTVTEESTSFNITLTREDTKIGEIISRDKTYWYEVEYNDDTTLIGKDNDGHKEFVLMPEAGDKKEVNN